MFKYISFIISVLIIANLSVKSQVADFVIRDTVCVNQNILIQNTTIGGSSFYWNFCSGDLSITPSGINMGNIGALDRPVYSSIAKDGNNYYVFISNNTNGAITRLAFGNSLINIPVATNLGNFGVMGASEEGIEIKKDVLTGNWFGLIVIGGYVDNIFRLNFGNSLNNIPTIENLGNVGNQMNYGHTIYTFYEGGDWYSFVGNYWGNTILRLDFGNSLGNIPKVVSLGNIGGLNGPVGFYPIQENGQWYLFVVNRDNSTLSRLNFGNSLLNFPTGINLGNIDGSFYFPRSISILRDCGTVFGFVVNQGSSDIIRLTFPDGLLSAPRGLSLGNMANFSFPHHISELFRIGDSLFAFVMNVENNTISRLCFASCNNSSIPSSNLQNPPAFSYSSPGKYNIRLVVNEGLPTQSNYCREVIAISPPHVEISGDSTVCVGGTIRLTVNTFQGSTYYWTGPNGFSTTLQNVSILNANMINSGDYTLIVSKNGCSSELVTKRVNVVASSYSPEIMGDTSVCTGETISLTTSLVQGITYKWTGPDNYTATNSTVNILNADSVNAGLYSLIVTQNDCPSFLASRNVSVIARPKVYLGQDTTFCPGNILFLDAANTGCSYKWNTGAKSQTIIITEPGNYSVNVSNGFCSAVDDIEVDVCNPDLWLPNVFTPNNDGINERFRPVIYGTLSSYQIVIYNRWGQQLYESADAYTGWDGNFAGNPCPTGAYFYIIEYSSGRYHPFEQKVKRGSVTLLR